MERIGNAPWIEETERTGYCSSGWWNNPPERDNRPRWCWDYDVENDFDEGKDCDVYYGNACESF